MLLIYRKIRFFRFRTKTKRDRYSAYVQSKLILIAERADVANIQKNSIFQIQPFFAQILRENLKKHEKIEKIAKLQDKNEKRSISRICAK